MLNSRPLSLAIDSLSPILVNLTRYLTKIVKPAINIAPLSISPMLNLAISLHTIAISAMAMAIFIIIEPMPDTSLPYFVTFESMPTNTSIPTAIVPSRVNPSLAVFSSRLPSILTARAISAIAMPICKTVVLRPSTFMPFLPIDIDDAESLLIANARPAIIIASTATTPTAFHNLP